MRTVAIVTGTRADFGNLQLLMQTIDDDADLTLQLMVTGMHLSPEFGLTWQEIEQAGFTISAKIEILLSSDTPVGIAKSIGLAMIGFADALERLQPDILLVLGDRFEVLAAVQSAMIARIPVAHINGGERTEGVIDEAFRHAITKQSHIHFVATDEYRRRVIQLGENPESVFNVGELGLEGLHDAVPKSQSALEADIGFMLGKRNILVTFHPVTLEHASSADQFQQLLNVLDEDEFSDIQLIFTKANADTEGRILNQMLEAYVDKNAQRCIAFTSMGRVNYLNAMRLVDGVVGNSSSGIVEAPSFGIGAINIGDRQRGRVKSSSTIDCAPQALAITHAMRKLFSMDFKAHCKGVINPYYKEGAIVKTVNTLKTLPLEGIVKKTFYDMP